ncbi:MAG: apolipoprotein N-acyltransferase [Treponemataceae bacterium]
MISAASDTIPRSRGIVRSLIERLGALVLSSLLFTLSFPNPLVHNGLSFFAWIAFVPVFWAVNRSGWISLIPLGAFYGYFSYSLYNYWLAAFHPLAGLVVGFLAVSWFITLFPLLKLADKFFPKYGYLLQWLLWISHEYMRTRGFMGYSYGISGYSQWNFVPLIQLASVFGVWGVCALVVFPSSYLAAAFKNCTSGNCIRQVTGFFHSHRIAPVAWMAALILALGFGFASQVDYSSAPKKRLALIQHNTDPWRGGLESYRENFAILKRLSNEALASVPAPDIVVWSETAFVPRIYWHKTYRDDPESYELVKELLEYLRGQSVPFIIGNDDGRKEVGENGGWERVDYNAVLLYEKGEEKAAYRKLHLVPFTEHFPYRKQFPFVYDALVASDTHFWKTGAEPTVMKTAGVAFSTPICFEDTFGYLSRLFVRRGAEVIVNLTNDAWANSLSSQMQHATMAVFRAVENKRSLVRSTASGQTCAVDPNGRILAMAKPFSETWLMADIPIYTATSTLYTFWGDIPVILLMALVIMILLFGIAKSVIDKKSAP